MAGRSCSRSRGAKSGFWFSQAVADPRLIEVFAVRRYFRSPSSPANLDFLRPLALMDIEVWVRARRVGGSVRLFEPFPERSPPLNVARRCLGADLTQEPESEPSEVSIVHREAMGRLPLHMMLAWENEQVDWDAGPR